VHEDLDERTWDYDVGEALERLAVSNESEEAAPGAPAPGRNAG